MKEKQNFKNVIILLLIIIILILTITFLMMSSKTIKVSNKDNLSSASWNVHFENLNERISGNAKITKYPELAKKNTYIGEYEVVLKKPGDSVTFTFDVINEGTINAILKNIVRTKLKCKSIDNNKEDEDIVCNNIKYTLKYKDGTEVKEYDTLNKKERKNMVLTLKYDGNILPNKMVKIKGLDIILLYNQI